MSATGRARWEREVRNERLSELWLRLQSVLLLRRLISGLAAKPPGRLRRRLLKVWP
jgi:hypothetical protein